MIVEQFNDEALAHYSYAIVSNQQMAIVDPARNPYPYYQFAEKHNAIIVAVFETHPHADFVSSHLQIHEETGATIYVSKDVGADYPHTAFNEQDQLTIGEVNLTAINTPGHSPDGITIVAKHGKKVVAFTGDTLFVGDVGRPDLREHSGSMQAKRKELATMMFQTIQTKFTSLPDDTIIYPAHGNGTLCGKQVGEASSSTLGQERETNWAFQIDDEDQFVDEIVSGQPFIPSYFSYNVEINKVGAKNVGQSIANVPLMIHPNQIDEEWLLVDVREEAAFKKNHYPNSINIQAVNEHQKFETWLGSVIQPEESFALVVQSINDVEQMLHRVAKIGYETQLSAVIVIGQQSLNSSSMLDAEQFFANQHDYTIIDIRNKNETTAGLFFEDALPIPLHQLREQAQRISTEKPIVVHCAGGYRSAIGSSILQNELEDATVYDLSEQVNQINQQ